MILMFPLKSPKGYDALLKHRRHGRQRHAFAVSLAAKFAEKALWAVLTLTAVFMAFLLFSILRPVQTSRLQHLFEQATSFERPLAVSARTEVPL